MQDETTQLQVVIDRLLQGDLSARRELLDRTINRLRRLAAKMLHGSFPAIERRHDVDSILHETWLRLLNALETVEPLTVQDFFRLAAHKVRQVLLDMAQRQQKLNSREVLGIQGSNAVEPSASLQGTFNPAELAAWTEFHGRVALLPDEERQVFEMHYYLDVSQAEVSKILECPPRQVSRLWIRATERLMDGLSETSGLL